MNALIQLNSVALSYNRENKVLHGVDLSIHEREILTIIGPNGAGKSSLLKVIAGLEMPSSGSRQAQSGLKLGYVPQKLSLDRSMPIKVSRFLSLGRAKKDVYRDTLEQVKGQKLWDKQMSQLSGGELQRVLLARAIAQKPSLLLLDEPLQGVDVSGQLELYELIASIRDSHSCSVVMVSHDLHLVMAQCDRVICLNGHICCDGRPESVSQHPEYLSLFGKAGADKLAIYTHHHDHTHHPDGKIEHLEGNCQHD
jgi:zinc transport system ATP-binding protein